eukprot:1309463-Pyramimonas_sp.AAC.3
MSKKERDKSGSLAAYGETLQRVHKLHEDYRSNDLGSTRARHRNGVPHNPRECSLESSGCPWWH